MTGVMCFFVNDISQGLFIRTLLIGGVGRYVLMRLPLVKR